jgi:uncharacterized protein (DUF1800 family)
MRCWLRIAALLSLLSLISLSGCGGGGSNFTAPPTPQIVVTVSPSSANIRAGDTQLFTASVTGTANTAVTWSVNGTAGGNATLGTINATGLFTAPATLPNPANVTITATSSADASKSSNATGNLLNPIAVVTAVQPTSLDVGTTKIDVFGSKFVQGAVISVAGVAQTTTFVSATHLSANVTETQAQVGTMVAITVSNPDPGAIASAATNIPVNSVSARAAARFLEQATFGPTPALMAHVQQIGFDAFLTEQFNATPSTILDPSDNSFLTLQTEWMNNALNGQDQVRQRMAFALEQIWVISGVSIATTQAYGPYLRVVQTDALGNFRTLMLDVTLNPAMGRYLDMVNNDKPTATTHANENYAREIMQLFTIGLFELNTDGSVRLDATSNPIPTYTQDQVQSFARAFTGFTFPTKPGSTAVTHNPEFYGGTGVMLGIDSNHDTDPKAVLNGVTLPAGQTALADLNGALDNIFNEPTLAPYICKNLIQHFTTSNPSPAYVARVTSVFNNDGSNVRGNLRAVVRAILLDAEARAGDNSAPAANFGHLREPILYVTGLLRALGATSDGGSGGVNNVNQLVNNGAWGTTNMGQRLLFSPTVFNYFVPDWIVPGTNVLGPEFQIQTPATEVIRANFVNTFVQPGNNNAVVSGTTGTSIDFTRYAALAANTCNATTCLLLDALNDDMMHGQMSANMRTSIITAVNAVAAANTAQRAKTAVYLIGTSSQYQVMH